MKKILFLSMVCMLMLSTSFAQSVVYEKPDVAIVVNGVAVESQDVPIIINSRTLVPLRTLLVALGVPDNNENIQWIAEKRQVKVYHENVEIQLDIDSDTAYINKVMKKLDSPATIYNSRTYLPAKFVGEALGYNVLWDSFHPAVVVVKNSDYEFNKQMFSDMIASMENISNYKAEFAAETLITVSDSNYEEYKQKVVYENVDLVNNLAEIKTLYNEGTTSGTLEYYSDSMKYYNKDYANNFPAYSWQKSKYNATLDNATPYQAKKKLLDFKIGESMHGMMKGVDLGEEEYCFYNITNNETLLKCLAEAGLYYETIDGNDEIKHASVAMYVDKNFILPTTIKIEVEREVTGNAEYGVDKIITENSSFYLTVAYDQDLNIVLPQ